MLNTWSLRFIWSRSFRGPCSNVTEQPLDRLCGWRTVCRFSSGEMRQPHADVACQREAGVGGLAHEGVVDGGREGDGQGHAALAGRDGWSTQAPPVAATAPLCGLRSRLAA